MRYLAAIVALAASLTWSTARAQSCDPPGSDEVWSGVTITSIDGAIVAMESAVVLAITQSTGQISGYLENMEIAIAKLLDAQTADQQRIIRQQAESGAVNNYAPSILACNNITGALGMSAASVAAIQNARLAAAQRITWDTGSGTTGGVESRLASAYTNRLQLYAGPREQAAGLGIGQLPNADIMPGSTILSPSTYATQAQLQAAMDAALNLTNPIPDNDFPLPSNKTPAGRAAWLARRGEDARLSLAHWLLDNRIADRAPNSAINSGTMSSNAWVIGMMQQLPTADPIPQNVSYHQLLETLIKGRFENPNWYVNLAGMEPAAVQRELAQMGAMNLMLQWKDHLLLEEIATATASRLAIEASKSRPIEAHASIPVTAAPSGP